MEDYLVEKGGRKWYITERNGRLLGEKGGSKWYVTESNGRLLVGKGWREMVYRV
jgi:hypothetical protein